MHTPTQAVYQFGQFQVNAASGELFKNGRRVKLQEQPFRLLVVLLENAGEVVTREELRSRIWPKDTFVDFEGSLRVAVRKLREALGDDADNPRFIETIPKRGYRFLSSGVRSGEATAAIGAAESAAARSGARGEYIAAVGGGSDISRLRSGRWILSAVAAFVAIAATTWLLVHRPRRVLTERDTIVLADFANSTGNSVFDGSLRQGLAVQLEQSPFLSIVSDEEVTQTLHLMDLPAEAKLTPDITRQICQRTGSAADLEGSISQVGTQFLLTIRAVDCSDGRSLASSEARATDVNHVLEALGNVSSDIRNRLGESLSTVRQFNKPLEQATTPSLEALMAFSSGIKVINSRGSYAAIPFFQHAIELDPQFALAYAYLGIMENDILEPTKAGEYERRAYELRNRTSEVEKYSITATYEMEDTGNLDKAADACQLWAQAYPRAFHPHDLLAGAILPVMGQYERAADEASEAMRLNPDFPIAYVQRILNLLALNRIEEAKATYAQALQRKLSNPLLNIAAYQISFFQSDAAGMAQQVAKTEGVPGFEDQLLNLEGDTAAYFGRLGEAREDTQRAIDSSRAAGQSEAPLTYSITSGLREAWFGNRREALKRVSAGLRARSPRDALYLAALAFAYAGETRQAQVIADDLTKLFPEDTIVQFNFLPTLRAKLALEKADPSTAIADLKAATDELGVSTHSPFNWTAMYPTYVRGEAYLAAHRGPEAVSQFQKILDHRGIVLNQPVAVLAQLGLARAYAVQGDHAKARRAYEQFLALWKHADPDIPILKQANIEYLRLKR